MHTVYETRAFERAAADAGMSRDEVETLIGTLAQTPEIGDVMQGTGGCRKVRFGGRGKGKSGGYRIVTFFTGVNLPVFLITVFGRGEKANLSKSERNALADLSARLLAEYRNGVASTGERH